jgi:hypothetical protein
MSGKTKNNSQSLKPEQDQVQVQEMPISTPTEAVSAKITLAPEHPLVPESEQAPEPTPQPLSLRYLYREVLDLKQLAQEHSEQIGHLQEVVAKKRKPMSNNGKIKIRDKQTGTVYPSKNNAYRSLLKAGELKDLVEKGLFGPVPEKNTFGWYVLARERPDRFEELKEA